MIAREGEDGNEGVRSVRVSAEEKSEGKAAVLGVGKDDGNEVIAEGEKDGY